MVGALLAAGSRLGLLGGGLLLLGADLLLALQAGGVVVRADLAAGACTRTERKTKSEQAA
jgi:hypothetical protein